MKRFDAQLRSETCSDDELRNLAYFGVTRAVTTAYDARRFHDADDLLKYFRRLVGHELDRLQRLDIDGYGAVGVHPRARPSRAHPRVWAELPGILGGARVVAVGEIGAWDDTRREWELFDLQVRLAQDHDLPVVLVAPADLKVTMTYKMMARLDKLAFDPGRCLLTRMVDPALSTAVREEFVCAVAAGEPHLEPREAASLLSALFDERPDAVGRVVLSSSLDASATDVLGVPKLVEALQDLGADPGILERIAHSNAERFFGVTSGR